MTFHKRLFDIVFAMILIILLAPLYLCVAVLVLLKDGRPILYRSERMHAPDIGFQLVKFRTMKTVDEDSGVSGGDKSSRVTKTGAFLRKTRLDEVPQLFNILKGDMSFVGPRPPLRQYVEQFPQTYAAVLRSRPGVTGLATIVFHAHEENILADCENAEETDAAYTRRCVPRKAQLDLIYARHASICFDAAILLRTLFRK